MIAVDASVRIDHLRDARAVAMERWMRPLALAPTIRKTADLLIGTFCLARGLKLLHDDRNFDELQQPLGSAVVQA